jgi:hypothetical protein
MSVERSIVLLERGEFSVRRLNGVPRDAESGQHKRFVAFASPTVGPRELARLLRQAADLLDRSATQPQPRQEPG